ncbi:MAG: hypothetical protein U0X58_05500 [Flavobacteriaceae bacterium]
MRKILLVFALMIALSASAQRDINSYQYVIVPAKFDFLKKENQYNLNTLTKMYFEKYGFKVYMSNATPLEILSNKCDNLYVSVAETGNFMKTKMQVFLLDCKKDTISQSQIGTSKEKDFNVSYNLALREALKSLDQLNYHYVPDTKLTETTTKPVDTPLASEPKAVFSLQAKATANGYELVDSSGKTIMKLLKTSRSDMFTAFKSGQQGALILKNKTWFFEYYQGEQFVSEPVEVKIPN